MARSLNYFPSYYFSLLSC